VIATGDDGLNPHHFMDVPPSAAVLAIGPQLTFMTARELHHVKNGQLSPHGWCTGWQAGP
jgi:hypothetical protein